MKLSVVNTLYNSSTYLEEFHRRMTQAVTAITSDYEIIYVNDGSPDNSFDMACDMVSDDTHVRVVDLSRNYQHLKAMMTGLEFATGEHVFLIDCDLEEDPEWLTEFWEQLHESKADVVYGVQKNRKGGLFERLAGRMFYKLVNWLSNEDIAPNMVTARLISQSYVRNLVSHRETEIYLGGLFAATGFNQIPRYVSKHSTSASTYTSMMKIRTAVNAVTSFSNKPLIMIFWLGMLIALVSGPILAWLIIRNIFFEQAVLGWASVMVSLWFLGGLIDSDIPSNCT